MKNEVKTPDLTLETAKKLAKGFETRVLDAVRKAEGIHGRTFQVLVGHAIFGKHEEGPAFAVLREGILGHMLKDNEVLGTVLKTVSARQVKKSVKVSTVQSLSNPAREYLIRQGHDAFVEESKAKDIVTLKVEETITDEPPPVQLISRLLDAIDAKIAARFLQADTHISMSK